MLAFDFVMLCVNPDSNHQVDIEEHAKQGRSSHKQLCQEEPKEKHSSNLLIVFLYRKSVEIHQLEQLVGQSVKLEFGIKSMSLFNLHYSIIDMADSVNKLKF